MKQIHCLSRLVVVAAASLLLSACATVTRGTKEALVVESDPSGAMVEVNGQRGTTPTSFKLSRKFEGPVLITREGYEPVTVQITSQVATAGGVGMAGNALIGGLIGAGIDVATGSTNELKPNPIKVTLVRQGPMQAPVVQSVSEPAPVVAPIVAPLPVPEAALEPQPVVEASASPTPPVAPAPPTEPAV